MGLMKEAVIPMPTFLYLLVLWLVVVHDSSERWRYFTAHNWQKVCILCNCVGLMRIAVSCDADWTIMDLERSLFDFKNPSPLREAPYRHLCQLDRIRSQTVL